MPYTTTEGDLLASVLPAVQVNTDLPLLSAAYASVSGTAPASRSFSSGETTTVKPKLNENALRLDLAVRYGGGARAVAAGLAITVPSGLAATVAAGHAVIDGIVEVPAALTGISLTNGAHNYLWLKQDGTILVVPGSTTPPVGKVVYIGQVVTAAGAATNVNYSGVVRAYGSFRRRLTGDAGAPSDSPPATCMLMGKTAAGNYLWDGTAWIQIGASFYQQVLNTLTWSLITGTETLTASLSDIIRQNGNNANSVEWAQSINVPAGSYKLDMRAAKGNSRGILIVKVANTTVATLDCYDSAADSYPDVTLDLGALVAGPLVLAISVTTKNSSSSAKSVVMRAMRLWQYS